MNWGLPGSSVHGILQAKNIGVDIPFSKWCFWPRGQTLVSCITGRFFTLWATRKVPSSWLYLPTWAHMSSHLLTLSFLLSSAALPSWSRQTPNSFSLLMERMVMLSVLLPPGEVLSFSLKTRDWWGSSARHSASFSSGPPTASLANVFKKKVVESLSPTAVWVMSLIPTL